MYFETLESLVEGLTIIKKRMVVEITAGGRGYRLWPASHPNAPWPAARIHLGEFMALGDSEYAKNVLFESILKSLHAKKWFDLLGDFGYSYDEALPGETISLFEDECVEHQIWLYLANTARPMSAVDIANDSDLAGVSRIEMALKRLKVLGSARTVGKGIHERYLATPKQPPYTDEEMNDIAIENYAVMRAA